MSAANPFHTPSVGATTYQLTTPESIGPVLNEIHTQCCSASLYPLPHPHTTGVVAPELVEDMQQMPVGMARLVLIDDVAQCIEWEATTLLQPSITTVCAIAHLRGGVRVQCILEGHWQARNKGWVLRMPWPTHILQRQRRRFQRYSVPLGQSYTASFSFGSVRHRLDIDDISLGGLALRGSRKETAMLFLGKTLRNVTIHLPHGLEFTASLKVHSKRSFKSFLLGEQVLVGCAMELTDRADDFESYLFAMQGR